MGLVSFVHGQVWRRLPRDKRRQLLFGTARLVAPKPAASPRPKGPIYVVGALRAPTGLGESARLCLAALTAAGYDARPLDVTAALFQPAAPDLGLLPDAAREPGPGTLIVHCSAPLMPFVLLALGHSFLRSKRVIGYWAWELPEAPAEWGKNIKFVHEIWTTSRFSAAALAPLAKGRPLYVVHHPVAMTGEGAALPKVQRDRPFTVLTIFNMASSFARKNPVAAIEAFKLAFAGRQDVRMIVKTMRMGDAPAAAEELRAAARAEGVSLLEDASSHDELMRYYREADVVISLHRSEGFGLVVAEAMLAAVPVVATDWSGTADFLGSDIGFPIPYRLVPARDPQGEYDQPGSRWAEPDIAAAASALAILERDAALARRLGEAGHAKALAMFGVETYAATVAQSLGPP